MSWTIRHYSPDNATYLGDLTPADGVGAGTVSMQTVAHDTNGTATLTVDPATATIPAHGHVLRLRLGAVDFAAWRVTGTHRTVISRSGHNRELVDVTCRELSLTGAIIQPGVPVGTLPARRTRLMGWPGRAYTETGSWTAATVIAVQGWASAFYTGQPAGWLDAASLWISDNSGDHTNAPPSTNRWFRHTITLASPVENLIVDFAGDNRLTAWFDDERIGDQYDYRESRRVELGRCTAGSHLFAGFLENAPDDGPPGGNPTAAIWTFRDGIDGPVIARSGTAAHVLPYTSPLPGMTDGDIMLKFIAENPSLGSITPTFTATVDSGGTAWPILTEPLEVTVGEDLDTYLRSRCDTAVDWRIQPDGHFDMWVKGGRGAASTLGLVPWHSTTGLADPSTVNVGGLEWEADSGDGFNALLVAFDDGFLVRPTTPPAGARYRYLEVPGGPANAAAVADGLLAAYGAGTNTATIEFVPVDESQWPGTAFGVWDTVAVPSAEDPDVAAAQRVRSVTFELDGNGDPVFGVELGSLAHEAVELIDRLARSGGGVGGLGGRAAAAAVARSSASIRVPARVSTVVFGSEPEPTVGASGVFQFPFACRVLWLRCTATSPSGTTTLQVRRGGATVVATLSMGAAATSDVVDGLNVVTSTVEAWDWNTTAVGGHKNVVITAGVAPLTT